MGDGTAAASDGEEEEGLKAVDGTREGEEERTGDAIARDGAVVVGWTTGCSELAVRSAPCAG